MKIKRIIASALAALTALSLCACGNGGNAESEEVAGSVPEGAAVITDMIGRQVEIYPGSYERVVCIGAGALRIYSYMGDVARLCGVEDIDNTGLEKRPAMFDSVARPYVLAYGDFFSTLPSCGTGGPNAQTAEAEKILSCNPDIVISEYEDADKADALQTQLGVPVITLKTGPDGVFDEAFAGSLRLLGEVFQKEYRAEELAAFVEAEMAEISSRTAGIGGENRPGVYICGLGNWGTTNHLSTSQSYAPFTVANIRNVVTDLGKNGVQSIEAEKFTALGAETDIMIIDSAAVKNIAPLYQEDPAMFDSCAAFQNGRVYLEMAYNAYYTNFEIALANTWYLAKCVYPELFEDIDMTQKTDEITKVFLGKELAGEIFDCHESYGGYGKFDISALLN